MTTHPEEMKVGSISEAQDELAYRRSQFPRMVHSVQNRYPNLVIKSTRVKDYISEARQRTRQPTNYRAKYG